MTTCSPKEKISKRGAPSKKSLTTITGLANDSSLKPVGVLTIIFNDKTSSTSPFLMKTTVSMTLGIKPNSIRFTNL